METSAIVVKHHGKRQTEAYDPEKLHASIIAACLSAKATDGQAETTAKYVLGKVGEWLQKHPEVTSHDIRIIAVKHLKKHHPEAAYLYEQHKITI